MLLVVRQPKDVVSSVVRERGMPAEVGPTTSGGWTIVWSGDAVPLAASLSAPAIWLHGDDQVGLRLTIRVADGALLARHWAAGAVSGDRPDEMADAIATLAGHCEATRQVLAVIGETVCDPDEVTELLHELFRLPDHHYQVWRNAVLVARLDPADAVDEAACDGPLFVANDGDWAIMRSASSSGQAPGVPGLLPLLRRRCAQLTVWRDGPVAGFTVSDGRQGISWDWDPRWQSLNVNAAGDDALTVLARVLGRPVGDVDLGDALHRPAPAGDPLRGFLALLGLPEQILRALDDSTAWVAAPGTRWVRKYPLGLSPVLAPRCGVGRGGPPVARLLEVGHNALLILWCGVVGPMAAVWWWSLLLGDDMLGDADMTLLDAVAFGGLLLWILAVLVPAVAVRSRRLRFGSGRSRWWTGGYTVMAAGLAVACAGCFVLASAILLTNGAVVGQPGLEAADVPAWWIFLAGCLVLVPTVTVRRAGGRGHGAQAHWPDELS